MTELSRLETTLQALVQEEYERTYNATGRLGRVVPLALRGVGILNTSVVSVSADNGIVSALMLATNKSMALAFLSYIRSHTAQAEFNCRQAVELSVLSAYLLANPDVEIIDDTNLKAPRLLPPKPLRTKAHKWLEAHEPHLNSELKKIKDSINDGFAHGGLYVAHLTIDVESMGNRGDTFSGSFFDNLSLNHTRACLLNFCRLVVLIVETTRRANERTMSLVMKDRLKTEIEDYARAADRYREALGRVMEEDGEG